MNDLSSDLDKELSSAFDAAMSAADTNTAETATTTQPADATATTEATAQPTIGGDRDEKGRFKAKDQQNVQPEGESKVEDKGQLASPKAGEPSTGEPSTANVRPPTSWSISAKAKFSTLDPEIQQEILKREQDIFNGIEQYKQGHQFSEQMQRAFAPYMATINSLGVTPDVAVQHLLTADHKLRYGSPAEKAAYLGHIAQQYGIDMGQLSTEQPRVDPTIAALQNKLHQIEQQVTQQTTQTQTAEQQYVNGEIRKFESDPANIYFNDVRVEMSALLTSGRATDLKDAYDKACWAHPQIRDVLLKQQNEAAERKRLDDLAQKVQTAKRAGFDVQGTGTAGASNSKALTLEEEIASQLG